MRPGLSALKHTLASLYEVILLITIYLFVFLCSGEILESELLSGLYILYALYATVQVNIEKAHGYKSHLHHLSMYLKK